MKIGYKILSICFIILSCNSDDVEQFKDFCSVNDPTIDLAWLKAEIEERELNIDASSKYYYISQAIHTEDDVIIYANCDPLANSVFSVFNCSGENIGFIGDGNFTTETLMSGKIIWQTNNFACEF